MDHRETPSTPAKEEQTYRLGTLLLVDACPRRESRTRRLAEACVDSLTGYRVERLSLMGEDLPTLDEDTLNKRTEDSKAGRFEDPMFRYAAQFAKADVVVIAAPFWDLSFPACLKKYAEAITVTGLTFRYTETGIPQGLCQARKLYYVTTAGGPILRKEFGYGYWEALAKGMFGIPETEMIALENLDIWGNDPEGMLAEAIREIREQI